MVTARVSPLALLVFFAVTASASVNNLDIERRIDAMSDEEKIGQLLFVGFDGTSVTAELRRMLTEWRVGGIAEYRQNIESPEQVKELNHEIREVTSGHIEPFIAVDQEGGNVRRLRAGVPELPGNMALGATRSPQLAYRAGAALGASLRALGFSMNFAPVLDVLSNPTNTALGTRAFSDDPRLVATLGAAFIRGQTSAGIISVAKHFPGQGGTSGDSHYELPRLDVDIEQLRRRELVPFRRAIAEGLPAMMTAHIALPKVAEGPDLPATVSSRILTGILRGQLDFGGLIITDELQMRGIHGSNVGDTALKAILAGADMILVVWDASDRDRIRNELIAAFRSGRLSESRVRESLRRILRAKLQGARPREQINDPTIAREIAENSIAVSKIANGPLLEQVGKTVVVGADGPVRRALYASDWFPTPPRVDDATVERASEVARNARQIVAIVDSENDSLLVTRLRDRFPDVYLVVVSLGSPAEIRPIARADAIVFAFSDADASQREAARVLQGTAPARGRLPLSN